jgi:hypothetical protein
MHYLHLAGENNIHIIGGILFGENYLVLRKWHLNYYPLHLNQDFFWQTGKKRVVFQDVMKAFFSGALMVWYFS